MEFFAVMPDFRINLIEVSDRVDSALTEIFENDIEAYRKIEPVDFYPDYTPKRGAERFRLREFRLPETMSLGMTRWHSREALKPEQVQLRGVKAVVGVQTRHDPTASGEDDSRSVEWAAFKRLDKSRVIDQRVLRIVWDRDTFDRIDGPGMTIPEGLDALYENDALFFNSYQTASGFLDLTDSFDEASEPQIDDVMGLGVLVFTDQDTSIHEFINSTNKRAMSMLWRSGRMASISVEDVKQHARKYKIDLVLDDQDGSERIVIPGSNKELKRLLDLLNQNYFPGIFDEMAYVANSKRPV